MWCFEIIKKGENEASSHCFDDVGLFGSISMLFILDVVSLTFHFLFC